MFYFYIKTKFASFLIEKKSVSSYYFKLHINDYAGKDKMKNVYEKFRSMPDDEKKMLQIKHFKVTFYY